jgi:single-stranded DNA-binding protein
MQQRGWTDKSGNKRTSWELQVEAVYFSGSKQDSDSAGGQKSSQYSGQNSYGGQGGYGGYSTGGSTYGGYSVPANPASDFAMLDDDDGQLPF